MFRRKITLVLGAGASISLGYPTGASLRKEILSLASPPFQELVEAAGLQTLGPSHLTEFIDAFRKSQMYSIDAFLARRSEFTKIGKQCIAAIILNHEAKSKPDRIDYEDGWYQYLWNKISTSSWEELNFLNLRVVTFNYDRSLEQWLLSAIQHSYGKTLDEAVEKLRSLQVVHVYGCLGSALPGSSEYLQYGYGPKGTPFVADSIQVIPEGRDNSPSLDTAKLHLLWADKIAFLGFGFDETNMMRLDATNTCRRNIQMEGGSIRFRTIYATALGLTSSEATRISSSIAPGSTVDPRFFDGNCIDMLREYSVFE